MSECWVLFMFDSQRTEGSEVVGKYLRWPKHKFIGGFCVRCAAPTPEKEREST